MLKVLWLCSWYPNRLEPFNGDFVKRHAEAASLYNKIDVIKLTPEFNGLGVNYDISKSEKYPNLTEHFVYYPKQKFLFKRILSYYKWYYLYKKEVKKYINKNGLPDLVHVHIPLKSGLISQWIKKKYKIPFVVTEHWGGYNKVVKNNYFNKPLWAKKIISNSFKQASSLHTVSDFLAKKIINIFDVKSCVVINNTVDTSFFFPQKNKEIKDKFSLIHISNGAQVKNVKGILDAFKKLDYNKFSLKIIGLTQSQINLYKSEFKNVEFIGPSNYSDVAKHLKQSDALILFSNMENSPCVIGEALCCNVPVIATNVGGIPELVNSENSVLVEPQNEDQLIKAIHQLRNSHNENPVNFSDTSIQKFSYESIGQQTKKWYDDVLKK